MTIHTIAAIGCAAYLCSVAVRLFREMKVSRGTSIDRFYLVKLFGFGVFVHRIHHSDPPTHLHNHPWSGLSLIWGGYLEETRTIGPDGVPQFDIKIKNFWNWVPAKRHHRVIVGRPVWTLFIHGRKCNRWTVIDRKGAITAEAPWEGEKGFKDYGRVQS